MPLTELPTRLKKAPLIDAIFETRFTSSESLSSILPGILFSKLNGVKNIERLDAADLPQQIRDSDPSLKFAPLIRVSCENVSILISDWSVAIACNLPYPGWKVFKDQIISTLKIIKDSNLTKKIERYSIKYINLLESTNTKEQVELVNLNLKIGEKNLKEEVFQVRIEIPENTFINCIQIVANVTATLPNNITKQGLIIDIDTIQKVDTKSIDDLLQNIEEHLSELHQSNKSLFFSYLKESTITSLEPEYE